MARENINKDLQIVKQSQSKLALDFFKVHDIKPSLKELLRLTDILVESVVLMPDQEFKETVKKFDEWIASKKQNT